MKPKKENRGGARKGSGRHPLPYKTKIVSFRVREGWVEAVKAVVKKKLAELKKSKK